MYELDRMKCQDMNTVQLPMQMTFQYTINPCYTVAAGKYQRKNITINSIGFMRQKVTYEIEWYLPEVQPIQISTKLIP